ncbi:MAG TPA: class I SAM-dependent methyltransferase [Patescibacteria group bacterium]
MKTLHCAICKQKEKVKLLYKATFDRGKINDNTFSARRTPDRMHYQFLKCLRCGLIFSSPIFDNNKITDFYSKSTFDYDSEAKFLKKTYGSYLKEVVKGLKGKLSLLDIGCGNGFFLEEAMNFGVKDVYGVEPGRKTVEKASKIIQKRIKVAMYDEKLFPKGKFSIITCFHTLDHIVNPNKFLKGVISNLKKNGKILFIVHDTKGMSVKLFGEKSPIFDIEHIYLFDKKSLAQIFKRAGFKNIQVFSIKNTYPLSYWFRMVPLPWSLKSVVEKLIFNTFLGDIPFTIPAGNIGIIAQK